MRDVLKIQSIVLAMSAILMTLPANALYDPAPTEAMSFIEGAWQGKLEYRDYQPPYKIVTLPTKLYVALRAPGIATLHYAFDDGPKKIVHSYDWMQIDLEKKTLTFGSLKPEDTTVSLIVSNKNVDGVFELVAERDAETKAGIELVRYQIRLGKNEFEMLKQSAPKGTVLEFRNKYSFKR